MDKLKQPTFWLLMIAEILNAVAAAISDSHNAGQAVMAGLGVLALYLFGEQGVDKAKVQGKAATAAATIEAHGRKAIADAAQKQLK